ncbi:MAG: tellurite resistance TerB family protein [Nannocystaceae bacterium]|nr:tellurite resistance TerB family protein [Nannocystaceae bacterium]
MGLLSKLTGMTSTKQPTDDVLLVHSMLLMAGADGVIEDEEIATVQAFVTCLSEFKNQNFGQLVEDASKMMRKYPSVKESVAALQHISTPALRHKAFVLAADIAMSSGDVDETEDQLLETMQRLLQVDDRTAQTVIWALQQKYAR